MAAIFAAGGRAPVIALERTRDGGRKILISGGGRCNVLPAVAAPERFVTDSSPTLLRAMLRAWPLEDQRRFFEHDVGLPLALEHETGKLFPVSNRARDVRDGLVALARRRGVDLRFGVTLTGLAPEGDAWRLDTTDGPLHAARVVLAAGGLSVPSTGSDGSGIALATILGHRIHATYPALTPVTLDANHVASGSSPSAQPSSPRPALAPDRLSGLSLPVRIRARYRGRTTESYGGFLFTHRGYSGPAVLDVSHVCVRSLEGGARQDRARLLVSWSTRTAGEWETALMTGDRSILSIVSRHLPERLALSLMGLAGLPRERRTSTLRREERSSLVAHLTSHELAWSGHEGYRKAEVTGGGVALDELHARTLESRRHRRLYLCGEMLDAFGPIGGHNFAWAWATGRTAGIAAAADA